MTTALLYAIHRTHDWWACLGQHLGYDRVTVLTDRRGEGDRWITDAYYAAYRIRYAAGDLSSQLLSAAEVDDVIARCRVLRWNDKRRAAAMVLAMADCMDAELDATRPDFVVSFPIDNYNQDVLARIARKRDVPYFELAISALPDMCMLIHRGKLITTEAVPDPALVDEKIKQIADPTFTPFYVKGQPAYTAARFLKTMGYFRLRAAFFKLYSLVRRDPFNTHYMDAQPDLGHKARLKDIRVTQLIDADWETRLNAFSQERRVLFGLQLFPEASIDYWIDDLGLLQQEEMLVAMAERLTAAGYLVVVKDHPLQFGFRKTELLDRLKALPNVVIAPYEVSGAALLGQCGVNVTATGTLGLQAAMLGKVSVTGETYYTTEGDFIQVHSLGDIDDLAERVTNAAKPDPLHDRQTRIIENLLRGSFDGDFISFRGFDPKNPNPTIPDLGRSLGKRLLQLGPDGEDWHRRHMPRGGGGHDGSPLN
jgi:hypothetical protein